MSSETVATDSSESTVTAESPLSLPQIPAHPGLTEDLGWILLGSLIIAFIFLRPQGLLPERRPAYAETADPGVAEVDLERRDGP